MKMAKDICQSMPANFHFLHSAKAARCLFMHSIETKEWASVEAHFLCQKSWFVLRNSNAISKYAP